MKKIWIFFLAPPAIALFVLLCGEVVMHLWNWLVPALFGGHQITFWQGLGLLVLCRLLFGSWSGGREKSRSRRQRPENWDRFTPEERENFKQSMRSRCGNIGTPASGTGEPA